VPYHVEPEKERDLRHIYLDMNIVADMIADRSPVIGPKVSRLKSLGFIFPYSPAHMEETAVIFRAQEDEETAKNQIIQQLIFIKELSNSTEYLPTGNDTPISVVTECPSVCFKRVIDNYEVSYWAEGNDEVFMSFKNNDSFRKVFGEDGTFLFEERRQAFGIEPSVNELPENELFSDKKVLKAVEAKLANYGLEISNLPTSEDLLNSHRKTELLLSLLFNFMEEIGYRGEKFRKSRSRMHDVSHAIYATRANFFVSRDSKLISKTKAVYHLLGIPTVVLTVDEFCAL